MGTAVVVSPDLASDIDQEYCHAIDVDGLVVAFPYIVERGDDLPVVVVGGHGASHWTEKMSPARRPALRQRGGRLKRGAASFRTVVPGMGRGYSCGPHAWS